MTGCEPVFSGFDSRPSHFRLGEKFESASMVFNGSISAFQAAGEGFESP